MQYLPQPFVIAALALFGLLFGSLANVVIWRFPRGESLSHPGSHCPRCGHAIAWYDNVPILSYVVLRGRCRACGTGISARYPLVELASGILWTVAGLLFGVSLQAVAAVFLFYLLLILAIIDIDTQRLPNVLVAILAGGGVTGVLVAEVFHVRVAPLVGLASAGLLAHPWIAAAAGVLLGAGTTGGIGLAYGLLRGKQGMGMGDVKLLAALGPFLGPYVLMALVIASMLGVVVGLIGARGPGAGARKLPFGPFLAAGALIVVLFGPGVWSWYAGLTGLS